MPAASIFDTNTWHKCYIVIQMYVCKTKQQAKHNKWKSQLKTVVPRLWHIHLFHGHRAWDVKPTCCGCRHNMSTETQRCMVWEIVAFVNIPHGKRFLSLRTQHSPNQTCRPGWRIRTIRTTGSQISRDLGWIWIQENTVQRVWAL